MGNVERTTLRDVASQAGVSPSTVSRALNRPEMLAPSTVARIMEVIAKLDYQPNQIASGLRLKASRIIGLVITDVENPFYGAIAKGVQDVAYNNAFQLLLFNSEEDPAKERNGLKTLSDHQAQGLVIVPTSHTGVNLRPFRGVPTVEVDRTSKSKNVHAVLTNNVEASREATMHLAEFGHRRIGIVAGRKDVTTGYERHQGYCEALQALGIAYDPRLVVHCRHDEESGYEAAMQLLDAGAEIRPTALFTVNNFTTMGAIKAIRALGLAIPRDISIVGFDDSQVAQMMTPPITIVKQPAYSLGYAAAQTLFGLIRSRPNAVASVTRLASTLEKRGSVDVPPTLT